MFMVDKFFMGGKIEERSKPCLNMEEALKEWLRKPVGVERCPMRAVCLFLLLFMKGLKIL